MVEGARLESVCRGNPTVGSNPTLSAKAPQRGCRAGDPANALAPPERGEREETRSLRLSHNVAFHNRFLYITPA